MMETMKAHIEEALSILKRLESVKIEDRRKSILERIRTDLELAAAAKTISQAHYHLKFIPGTKRKSWQGALEDSYDYSSLSEPVFTYRYRYRDNEVWSNGEWSPNDESAGDDISLEEVRHRVAWSDKQVEDVRRAPSFDRSMIDAMFTAMMKAKAECTKLSKGKLKTKASVFREILQKKHPRTFTGKDAKDAYIEASKKLGVPIRCNNIHEQIGYALQHKVLVKREKWMPGAPKAGYEWVELYGYTNNSLELKWISQKVLEAKRKEKEAIKKQRREERKKENSEVKEFLCEVLRP